MSYLENVVKPPTKPMTVNPHSKPSSVEDKDSVAPQSTFLTFNLRKMRLPEQDIQVEAEIQTDGGDSRHRVHKEVRNLQTTSIFSFPSRQCSRCLSGHHRGGKLGVLIAISKGILYFG